MRVLESENTRVVPPHLSCFVFNSIPFRLYRISYQNLQSNARILAFVDLDTGPTTWSVDVMFCTRCLFPIRDSTADSDGT